jgi:hypothetical protein
MDATSPPPATARASRQRWFVLGLLVFFLVLSAFYTRKVLHGGSALVRWREQLLELEGGGNIYERYVYPNPPIMALLLRPFADRPPLVGALAWFYLKVGMALAALYWVFRLVQGRGAPFPPWAKALVVLLSLRPVMGDLHHGNVNLFILFLVVGGLYAFQRGRPALGGLVLALGIACKVTPALFLPYFLWKRAWRALAGCAVGLLLWVWVVPAGFLGWSENQQLLASWYDKMVEPYVVGGQVTSSHENQSLPGLAVRLLTHSPSFLIYDKAHPDAPPEMLYDNLLALDPAAARWLVKGAGLLFVGLVVWRCRTPAAARGWRPAAEFSVVVLGMLLFCERTWKHHCVTLMLPFAVLCYYLAVGRPGRWLRGYLAATLALVALLMAATSTDLDYFWGDDAAKTAQVYGAYVWGYLLLLAALAVLLGRPGAAAPAARAAPGAAALPAVEVIHQRVAYCTDASADRLGNQTLQPPNRMV